MQSLSSAQGGQQQALSNNPHVNHNMYSTANNRRVGSSPIGGRVPDTSRDGRKLFVGGLLNEGKFPHCWKLIVFFAIDDASPLLLLYFKYLLSISTFITFTFAFTE